MKFNVIYPIRFPLELFLLMGDDYLDNDIRVWTNEIKKNIYVDFKIS